MFAVSSPEPEQQLIFKISDRFYPSSENLETFLLLCLDVLSPFRTSCFGFLVLVMVVKPDLVW